MTRLPRLPVGDARIVAGQLSPRNEPIRPRDEVRERCRAPPLDVLMRQREDDGSVSLLSGDDVIAAAMPAAVQAQAPPAPTVEEAEIATRRGRGLTDHRFPTCFVRGTARDDGLRIYPVASGTAPSSPPRWTPESDDPLLVWGSARLPKRVGDRVCRPPRSGSLSSPRSPSSFESGRAPGSGTSSPRGRSPATVASITRLLLSTTRRDAFSPSPTPLDRATRPRRVRRLSRSIRYRLCSRGV